MSRITAVDRLRRTLAIIPWIAAHPEGASLAEACERFQLSKRDLLADLDVVFLVGRYPYSPDELIDVVIDGDTVTLNYADVFRRPLRLTPSEGLALVAAGSVLASTPGFEPSGPLARALAKLAKALDTDPADALDVALTATDPDVMQALHEAVAGGFRAELDYYSVSRAELTTRLVDPWVLWSADGSWYLSGYCHRARSERTFRVDRISRATMTTDPATPAPPDLNPSTTLDTPEVPTATIEVGPQQAWAADAWPLRSSEVVGDKRRLTLPVAGRAWLESTLLQLGPDANLLSVDPRVGGSDLQKEAALRVLQRYSRDRHDSLAE